VGNFENQKYIMNKLLIVVAFLCFSVANINAQEKYGYLNFGNVVALMPDTKAADAQLETYQKQLVAKGEEMAKAFQSDYEKLVQAVQAKTLSPKDQATQEQALQQQQQAILAYEQEVIQKVQVKRDELLKPIVEKVQKAIEEVGKTNGYKMIFDTSVFNALLYVKESDDVLPLVKAKLGI
jgi:outer membrane protein